MDRVDVAAGVALGGRYLVRKPAWSSSAGQAYLGRDTILDRAVLVFPLPFEDSERVGAYAQIHHPGLLQIYDAGPGWMVCEHASGGRLAERLASGPLEIGSAARAVRDVTRAVGALHAAGVAHGAIAPDIVVFDEEGRAKIATIPADRPRPATTADDDAALGRLAWVTFTGAEPGAARTPKLPEPLGALLRRMISEDPVLRPRLKEIEDGLAPYARTGPPEPKPSFMRTEGRWLVPVLLLVALGAAAVVAGLRVDFSGGGFPIRRPEPTTPASPAALTVALVDDFDPHGSDREENPDTAPRAADGKEVTFWKTVNYTTARLGNAKPGVGLLFDLGASRRVSRIVVKTPHPGWKAEWRVAETPGADEKAFTPATAFSVQDDSTEVRVPSGTGRYWLLWITELARDAGGDPRLPFNAAVAEVQFFA